MPHCDAYAYCHSNCYSNGYANCDSNCNCNRDCYCNADWYTERNSTYSNAPGSPNACTSPIAPRISSDRCFAEFVAGIVDAGL